VGKDIVREKGKIESIASQTLCLGIQVQTTSSFSLRLNLLRSELAFISSRASDGMVWCGLFNRNYVGKGHVRINGECLEEQ